MTGRGLDAGILPKGAMRHFWIIANRPLIVCAGKIFCESSGKNYWRNCFGKNLGKSIIAGVEIFADGISWRGWKPIDEVRGSSFHILMRMGFLILEKSRSNDAIFGIQ